jgi:hypothetical protein
VPPKVGGALGLDMPLFATYCPLELEPMKRGAMWLRRGLTVGNVPQMIERLVSAKLWGGVLGGAKYGNPVTGYLRRHLHPEKHRSSTPRLVNVTHLVNQRNKAHDRRECSTVCLV